MTVKQLIEELSLLPQDVKVVVFDYADNAYSVVAAFESKREDKDSSFNKDVFDFIGIKDKYVTIGTNM